jgi:hypothetical protein
LSGRSHQVGRSIFTFWRLRVLAILSEPNFCRPPFPTLPPFACPALALFWSAASGNLIIRERDLGSRYFFRVYYLSTRGKLYSGFPFTVPSPAPCALLSMTSGILQVSSSDYIFSVLLLSGSPRCDCRTHSHRPEGLLPLLPGSGPTRAQITM